MEMDLATIEEIRQVKYRYLRCVDLKLWDELAGVFTPDATVDYGTQVYGKPLKLAGRDEIVGFLRDKLGPDMITVHRAGQDENHDHPGSRQPAVQRDPGQRPDDGQAGGHEVAAIDAHQVVPAEAERQRAVEQEEVALPEPGMGEQGRRPAQLAGHETQAGQDYRVAPEPAGYRWGRMCGSRDDLLI